MKYLRAFLNEPCVCSLPVRDARSLGRFQLHSLSVPFNLRETIGETVWHDDERGKFYAPPQLGSGVCMWSCRPHASPALLSRSCTFQRHETTGGQSKHI